MSRPVSGPAALRPSGRHPEAGAAAPRRWPWYLLVGSLAVNMLLGGILAAQALHLMAPSAPTRSRPGESRASSSGPSGALSPGDAAVLRRGYEAERTSIERMHQNMEAMRHQIRESIKAPTFDPEGLRRALEQAHATEAELRGRMDSRVIEVLGQLSPEGRRKLMEMGPPR
ncbi:periplasmic heavy metal sensor [Azospirillum baldaniorum]|uniref:Periplasmic heavy metal sensor n=1 Tax=Azospirillum baldaniorum TaxID=1064539 RepID=A0A9P1K0Z6_9PROT|nr:periplasmic heavy metal sensor [Azospirillum baldaniorum]CCD03535.1 conserved protein of unknown function [Azospirillum baldaniorum]